MERSEQQPGASTRVTEAGMDIEDYLDEVLKESFPASDPPSSWSGRDLRGGTRVQPSERPREVPDS